MSKQEYIKHKSLYKQMDSQKIFIIGIAGASGCGKTTLANKIKNKLESSGLSGVEIISSDNYYIPYKNIEGISMKAPEDFNWDLPSVLDLDLLGQHLDILKQGGSVDIPKYNFLTSQRDVSEESIDGRNIRVLIVEGLFVLFNESLRSKFDLKIFTLLDPDICLARRLARDINERKIPFDVTIKQYQDHVKPAYVNFIEPTKRYADIIISTSEYSDQSIPLEMIKSYILRNY
jgi:uridine kinase